MGHQSEMAGTSPAMTRLYTRWGMISTRNRSQHHTPDDFTRAQIMRPVFIG
jgi:hypothetical protein